jgi:PAS domain S-box-containing protein
MRQTLRDELPRWLSSASVAWMGSFLAALVLMLSVAFVLFQQREIERRDLQSTEMFARVLEDHANRSFNTIDIALAALVETVHASTRGVDANRLGPALIQAQQGMPFLRSLSLIDGQGHVLSSSVRDNVDKVIDLQRVPLPAPGAVDRLGTVVHGRDLVDVASAHGSGDVASPRNFIPLVRTASEPLDQPRYLVAVLNPDFFANEYELTLADQSRAAALFSLTGVLLTATESIGLLPGQSASAHRFFADHLPARESGSYIGAGIDGKKVITAFRTLRKRPLAVFVERDHATMQAELARLAGGVALACAAALLAIGAMVGLAWRSLRSHAMVHGALDDSRERVAASERDLRTLVESVHELIFWTDAEGRISFVNEGWQRVSGSAGASALGRCLSDLCLPADQARIDALFTGKATTEKDAVMAQIRTPEGELRTLEVSVAPVHSANGALAGFAGFAVDVSERQRARDALQSQLDFTARLIEVSPTPLFVKDEQGRFLTVNDAWLDLMAMTRAQVIGRHAAELFGTNAPIHAQYDERLMLSEDRLSYENRLLRPDGEQRDTVVTKVRFTHADGTPAGIIGSIIDVTEFREAERSTREARDAAERANLAKSEFIANISHELRTPLQSIIGFSELGATIADGHADFQEMFADILSGGKRMLVLVNGLLDVSKMESTVGSLTLVRHDLAALVAEVVKELAPLADRRELAIELHRPQEPLIAEVDAFRIQQVVRNVLANALRFAPLGSAIQVECEDLAQGGVQVVVRDHGPGIPVDELESIFDAFVQSTRTRDGSGGTGLGLTICRKIMSAHGGSIRAANADGGGAIMRVVLPACRQETAKGTELDRLSVEPDILLSTEEY